MHKETSAIQEALTILHQDISVQHKGPPPIRDFQQCTPVERSRTQKKDAQLITWNSPNIGRFQSTNLEEQINE